MATWLQNLAGAAGKYIDVASKLSPIKLPEFNLSESLQSYGGAPANQPYVYVRPAQAAEKTTSYPSSQVPSSYYSSPAPTTNTNTGGGNPNPNPNPIDTSNIQQNVDTGNAQIDRDYELFMSQLGGAESGLRSQAETSTNAIGINYAPVKTALQEQEATKLQGLTEQGQTAQNQEKTALQQSRDLFRQIQQQNVAQLSGMGISSSSVAEALAETLGVETARRIASVSQSANDVYNNIAKEKTNIQTYTKQKLADMEGTIATEKSNIQQQLMTGLNQINQARAGAAVDKANRRADLLQSAQNAIFQLQQNAQQFAQSLEAWAKQNTSALNAASSTDWNSLFATQLANAPSITGFTPTPSYNVDKYGNLSGQISYKQPNDELTNPFAT